MWIRTLIEIAPKDRMPLTSYKVFHGHEGLHQATALLEKQIGRMQYQYKARLSHGEVAFSEWAASSDRALVQDGVIPLSFTRGAIRR